MISTISGTWPVAAGSYVGGATLSAAYAWSSSRFMMAVWAYHGRPSVSAFARILSSMSVTLRMNVTS